MSRSYNETSVPNQRGRLGVKKDKRHSSKRVRTLPIETDNETLKKTRFKIHLDK